MKLHRRCLATIETLPKHYSFMCPLANARNTVRQNVKVYVRKNARQNVRVCQIECQNI
jgi:hypothetical protein